MSKNLRKKFYGAAVVALGLGGMLFGAVLLLEHGFAVRSIRHELTGFQVWAHRGYWKDAPESSLRSVRAAVQRGAKGVELDVNYVPAKRDFVLSYAYPWKEKDGRVQYVSEVMREYGAPLYYWLDFKNLNSTIASEAADTVKMLELKYGLEGRIFVESQDLTALSAFGERGIKHMWWINRNIIDAYEDASVVVRLFRRLRWKYHLLLNRTTGVSLWEGKADGVMLSVFDGIPRVTWTVNDRERLSELRQTGEYFIVLTDEDFF